MLLVAALFMAAGIALGYVTQDLFHAPDKVSSATFQATFRFNSFVGMAIAGGYTGRKGWRTSACC
ncbi:MAG: hypothetical protein WA635_01075 [Gallionella sp.]